MAITPDEFHAALAGTASEEVQRRVREAIESDDPVVRELIATMQQRACEWLRSIGGTTREIDPPADAGTGERPGEDGGTDAGA